MKTNLPKQEYELISICRQSAESGTPLICDDCGRVLFNYATIKGKQDGKIYTVGLTCVKRLLNKTIYFNIETMLDYENQLSLWNEAWNTRKWLDKQIKPKNGKTEYYGVMVELDDNEFWVELRYINNGWRPKDSCAGHTKALSNKFRPLFADIV